MEKWLTSRDARAGRLCYTERAEPADVLVVWQDFVQKESRVGSWPWSKPQMHLLIV